MIAAAGPGVPHPARTVPARDHGALGLQGGHIQPVWDRLDYQVACGSPAVAAHTFERSEHKSRRVTDERAHLRRPTP